MIGTIDIEQSFINYINNVTVKREIEKVVDCNGETFYVDLEELRDEDSDLFINIQTNFKAKYEFLSKSFETFCISNFDRKLDLSFKKPSNIVKIRDLKSNELGNLVSFEGTATRTTQVRPELIEASFKCLDCSTVINNVEQQYKFTEPVFCPNHLCANRSKFEVIPELCNFSNWQRIHVQESPHDIPKGSLPRNIDVIVRNELCEMIKPGSQMVFTGYPIVIPDMISLKMPNVKSVGEFRGILDKDEKRKRTVGKELNYKISFICISAASKKEISNEQESGNGLDILTIQNTPDLYNKLSESLFPSIHGHGNIKNAILLLLVGGCQKTNDIKLRGDINILLVGDPGTAKSQFLKQTSNFMARSVYTSGKSSSAAGLTAAVVRDSETGEFTIEAGALMLSDQGVCCIDEFDKMNYKDQVSIHEAMEQQTITIAKAGINATLNSRASILAASNPIKGRYDKRKSLKQNVNLSPPIMSRFDLYFVLIDKVDENYDKEISKYILRNHLTYNVLNDDYNETTNEERHIHNAPFSVDDVISFIKECKKRKPKVTSASINDLTVIYNKLRQESLLNNNNYTMTIRHLESLIRISEALAKIFNSPEITSSHINEAYRLLKSSLIEIKRDDIIISNPNDETKESFKISDDEYQRITNSLIYLIKSHELSKEEILIKYLELVEDKIDSLKMIDEEKGKAEKVLTFLIEREGVLYEAEDILCIHPNYDI